MLDLGEPAVYLLNALTPAFPQNQRLVEVMSDEDGHFAWEYSEGEAMLAELRKGVRIFRARIEDPQQFTGVDVKAANNARRFAR